MTTVDDVAAETGVPATTVLDVCRSLGIVASSGASGLSSTEHRELHDTLGAPPDLPPVVAGSTAERPDAPDDPGLSSLRARHDELVAEATRRGGRRSALSIAKLVRVGIAAFLVLGVIAAVVTVRSRAEDERAVQVVRTFTDGDRGSCLDLGGTSDSPVEPVPCAEPHDAEIFAVVAVDTGDDAPFPGGGPLVEQANEGCADAFEGWVGTAYEASTLSIVFLVPTPGTWSLGDRTIVCLAEDPDGPLVTPVRNSGR